jgi:hypothetical protein
MRTGIVKWAYPRRWSILAEALVATLVFLIALPVLFIAGREPAPVRVVTAYLEALQDGDVDEAESLVSHSYGMEADASWLTAEALSGDWTIESVELKSATEITVHAVIASGGARAEGAFRLEDNDGDLRIANPYVYLQTGTPLFTFTEINGVREQVETVDEFPAPIALYPGSYALFANVPEFGGGLPLLAMPGAHSGVFGTDTIDLDTLITGPLVDSAAFETRINEAVAAWIDSCAASTEIAPAGCPFSAAYSYGVAYDGHKEFTEVGALEWAVETYPKVRFGRDLRLDVVEPGTVLLTGTGTALGYDGESALDGRCTVDFWNTVPAIGDDGSVAFTLYTEQGNTCL